MIIKIKPDDRISTVIESGTRVMGKYYYIPGWFEKMENGDYNFHHFEKLPDELITTLKLRRK